MAEIKLTDDQRKVVDAHDCSLLVAAAAGSGKTAVLVKRIIEKITDKEHPADISRMLIVTFTRAAAAEMKERIRKAIDEALAKDPQDLHLQQQAAAIINAQISTIDSFCTSVVKENFEALQIDPGFTNEDQAAGELLQDDILQELFEEEYARTNDQPEAPFRILVRSFGSYNSDDAAKDIILRLFYAADNNPDPEEWLDSLAGLLDQPFSQSPVYAAMLEETKRVTEDAARMSATAAALCDQIGGPKSYIPAMEQDALMFRHIIAALQPENGDPVQYETVRSALNVDFCAIGRKGKEDDETIIEQVKKIRGKYKKTIDDLKTNYFYCSLETHDQLREKTNAALHALILETREFMLRLAVAKRENNAYSFSDIAHMAYKILCVREGSEVVPSGIAKEMSKNYDAIMIDEYQDSSYIQEYILRSISGEADGRPNLFMVGDVKQSIYSFRNARPELFTGKYSRFTYDGDYRKIDLSMNFRSRKAVLDAVNVIMRGIMRADTAEIEYDKAAALYFGSTAYTADSDANDTEIILIPEKKDGEEAEETAPDTDDIEITNITKDKTYDEAVICGTRILQLMAEKFQVAEKPAEDGTLRTRDLRFGDIAVLVQNNKNVSDRFVNAFRTLGIPIEAENTAGFFGAMCVEKVLSLLRVLDNPYNDIPMAAVLYSDFGGFTAEDLAVIKATYGKRLENGRSRSLFDTVKLAAAGGNEKAKAVLELLDRLGREASYLTVHEIVEMIYEVTGFKDAMTVLPDGDRRAANLDYLVTLAKQYEKSSYAGLHDFLRYIDRLTEKEENQGGAGTSVQTDCVRLSTIHKSKGLEFPVVFLCTSGTRFNLKDTEAAVLIDDKMGLASICVDTDRKIKMKSAGRVALSHRKRRAAIAEKARNLYVAMTRAKEKLIIMGTVSDAEKVIDDSMNCILVDNALPYTDISSANTFFDMLLPVVFNGANDTLKNDILEKGSGIRLLSTDIGDEHFGGAFRIMTAEVGMEAKEKASAGSEETAPAEMAIGEHKDSSNSINAEAGRIPTELEEEFTRRRDYIYPYLSEAKAPMRVSVSELKHRAIDMLEEGGQLLDMENPGGSVHDKNRDRKEEDDSAKKGALRGTLYHEVFEKLQYTGDYSTYTHAKESIEKEVDRLIAEGFLPADIMDTVRISTLTAFTMSSIGQEMIAAFKTGRLHREQAFVYALTPEDYRRLSGYEGKTDRVMIQGIIDAYFEAPEGLVVVDYKTDHISSDAARELTMKYRVQLELYGQALEDITGKPVVRCVLYSVSKDQVIEI